MERLGQVVDVVCDTTQQFAPSCPIDISEWDSVELVLHVSPQATHQSLHHAGQGVGTEVLETGRGQVKNENEEQQTMETSEVDPRPALMEDPSDDDVGAVAEELGTEDRETNPT